MTRFLAFLAVQSLVVAALIGCEPTRWIPIALIVAVLTVPSQLAGVRR